MEEEWREVADWPQFQVSRLGRVRREGRVLRGSMSPKGYRSIVVYPGERSAAGILKPLRWSIHRAVCIAFNGSLDTLKANRKDIQVAHLNGDPGDNRASNLAWVTAKENSRHRAVHGTQCRGETQGNSRLSEADVKRIRAAGAEGVRPPALAVKFGISREHARDIVARKRWAHI